MKTLLVILALSSSIAHADHVETCEAIATQMDQSTSQSEYDKLTDQAADLDCDDVLNPSDR